MYRAQENRAIALLPIWVVGLMLVDNQLNVSIPVSVLCLAIASLSGFIQYQVRIDCGMVHYEVLFFKWNIYRRILAPENIHDIRFNRYDWCKKGAVIRMKDKKRIRLIHFKSNELMERLETFANLYNVDAVKSKDYLLLERMDATKKRPS